ncbi:hypothetical protein R3P38DRAFT_3169915 [Favolaschia claudopus]|uniref:Uncharacterized protein n=1 Tax=Favolaschia claudopus TaxID=2862362 RepID=A0AAW0DV25_9AGAR
MPQNLDHPLNIPKALHTKYRSGTRLPCWAKNLLNTSRRNHLPAEIDPSSLQTPVIQSLILAIQKSSGSPYASVRCSHMEGHSNTKTYPVWVVKYWAEVQRMINAARLWRGAFEDPGLLLPGERDPLREWLLALSWDSRLRGFGDPDIEGLANLCASTAWLKASQINQALELQ